MKKKNYFIGIDIGLLGAITILTKKKEFVNSYKMPVIKNSNTNKNIYDTLNIINILKEYSNATVIMEQLSARPGQGVSSMFSLGYGCGLFNGLCNSINNKVIVVHPQKWQNSLTKLYFDNSISNAFKILDYDYIISKINNETFKQWFIKYINLKSSLPTKIKSAFLYYCIDKELSIKYSDNNIVDSYLLAYYGTLNQ